MKAIDIILPPPKTELEEFQRWMNRMQSQFLTMPWTGGKKIEVTYVG